MDAGDPSPTPSQSAAFREAGRVRSPLALIGQRTRKGASYPPAHSGGRAFAAPSCDWRPPIPASPGPPARRPPLSQVSERRSRGLPGFRTVSWSYKTGYGRAARRYTYAAHAGLDVVRNYCDVGVSGYVSASKFDPAHFRVTVLKSSGSSGETAGDSVNALSTRAAMMGF
jgi:hypothetical protein